MGIDFTLDHGYKSYPFAAPPCLASELAGQGWNVLANDLPFPLAVIQRSALNHNIAWMQAFARRKGVALARQPLVAESLANGDLVEVLPEMRLSSPLAYWLLVAPRSKLIW